MSYFCSIDLAARIERAEAALISDGARCAAAARPPAEAGRILTLPVAGGVAVWAGDGSPLNKVVGVGFAGVPAADELDRIERSTFERGASVRFEVSTCGDPAIGTLLTRRGYTLAGFEYVLALPLAGRPPESIAEGIVIERAGEGAAEFAVWLDAVVDGFANPDEQGIPSAESFAREVLAQVIGELTAAPGFSRYLARRAGQAAGGASLRIDVAERIAQLAGAATVPAHRRHGVQTSLLAARLADARAAGCEFAVVTTQPGSKSHQNVQRQGFELFYSRAVLVREPES
jgi:GNAT superfamily N-acetyltransferase